MGVELDRELAGHMLDWTAHKDLLRVAQWVEPAMLGTFVKAVMRVVTYVEVLKEVLLGLGQVAAAPTHPLPPSARASPSCTTPPDQRPPPPLPRTNLTSLVPPLVLSGHAASLTP